MGLPVCVLCTLRRRHPRGAPGGVVQLCMGVVCLTAGPGDRDVAGLDGIAVPPSPWAAPPASAAALPF